MRHPFRPLWQWVSSYHFLALGSLFLFGIAGNWLFWGLGLPALFWHENFWKQLVSGVFVGMFFTNAGVVGFLLASRQDWITDLSAGAEDASSQRAIDRLVWQYLLRTTLPLLLVLAALATRAPDSLSVRDRLGLPGGAVLGAAIAWWGIRTTRWAGEWVRSWWLRRRTTRAGAGDAPDRHVAGAGRTALRQVRGKLDRINQRYHTQQAPVVPVEVFHRAAAAFFIGQVLFFVACGLLVALTSFRWLFPAAAVLAAFVSVLVCTYGAVRWRYEERRLRIVGVAAVVWVVLAAAPRFRHTLHHLSAVYRDPVPLVATGGTRGPLFPDDAALAAWAGRGGRRPLVVLAVDGGGIRAATWIVSMLTTLEKDIPGFPYHVRIVTGASGGMVGASYYAATLQEPGGPALHARAPGEPALTAGDMIEAVSTDSLEAVVQRLVFRDILPTPLWGYRDRGWALERQWEENTGVMHLKLADLRQGEEAGWRPSLVFSPMLVEDGRRLLISNLDLARLTATETGASPIPPSVSAVEFAKLVPEAAGLRLSTAARLSASVAYVSPAAEIPTMPLRRVVDAGYYEEHGVDLATAWLLAHAARLPDVASKVALIQMPDQSTVPNRLPNPCPPGLLSRGLAELASPPQAIFAGWTAAQTFRNDQTVDLLGRVLNERPVPGATEPDGGDYFRSFVFEPYQTVTVPRALLAPSDTWEECAKRYCAAVAENRPVPLSWHLVARDVERLRDAPATQQNCRARQELVRWWTDDPARVVEGCDPGEAEPNALDRGEDICADLAPGGAAALDQRTRKR